MQRQLCDKYGFDKAGRERRLALLGFSDRDTSLAMQLQREVLQDRIPDLVEQFYGFLQNNPDMASFLDGADMVAHLKQTHANYLQTLGVDYASAAYFENRLHIGAAHARAGLPLNLYLAAYRLLIELIVQAFPETLRKQSDHCLQLVHYVNRIAMLDMSLAIDVYHQSQVGELVDSLRTVAGEREELVAEVQRDTLTRLASRNHLLEVLSLYLEQARAGKLTLTVAMADLDRFKQINDQYGHLVGDQVLKEVAHRILGSVRGRDLVGRYGGEEFMLLFPNTPLEMATRVAERIRKHVAATPVHLPERTIPITLSIGLAQFEDGDSLESLINRADRALYKAKRAGRNCIAVA
jgi:diguanylate cyclase (GGDEF)-like protein